MVLPFQLIKQENEKNKSRKHLPREVEGRLWAEIKPNIGGDYGFKGESFMLKWLFGTGIVQGENKWLLGVLNNPEEVFEIKHQKVEGKNDKGYTNYVANPEQEQLQLKWMEDGSLVAMLCNGIPQLELLAQECQNKLFYNDVGYEVRTKEPDKELFKQIAKEITESKNSAYGSSRLNKHHKEFLKDNSWFYLFFTSKDVDAAEDPSIVEVFNTEFDEEKNIVGVSPAWSPPTDLGGYQRRSSGGGGYSEPEKDKIQARFDACLAKLGGGTINEVAQIYGLNPVHLTLSLILGSSCELKTDYVGLLHSKTPTIEKAETHEASTPESNGKTPEKEEPQELYGGLILGLASSRAMPKEIDAEFLTTKGNTWNKLFYQVLTSHVKDCTPYSRETKLARTVSAFVQLKFKSPLHQLSEDQLKELLSMSEVVPDPAYSTVS